VNVMIGIAQEFSAQVKKAAAGQVQLPFEELGRRPGVQAAPSLIRDDHFGHETAVPMYDSSSAVKQKLRQAPVVVGAVSGRRTLAFILTLTRPATSTIAWVRISDVLLRFEHS